MLYDISLRITCSYQAPAAGGRHVLYLTPADIQGRQRAITSLLDIDPPPDERIMRTDFFGNTLLEAVFRAPHAEIDFRLRARVERMPASAAMPLSPPYEAIPGEVAAIRSLAADAPHHFLADSPRIHARPEFGAYARAQLQPGMAAFEAIEAIGKALDRDMKFDPGSTDVRTLPEDAFAAIVLFSIIFGTAPELEKAQIPPPPNVSTPVTAWSTVFCAMMLFRTTAPE